MLSSTRNWFSGIKNLRFESWVEIFRWWIEIWVRKLIGELWNRGCVSVCFVTCVNSVVLMNPEQNGTEVFRPELGRNFWNWPELKPGQKQRRFVPVLWTEWNVPAVSTGTEWILQHWPKLIGHQPKNLHPRRHKTGKKFSKTSPATHTLNPATDPKQGACLTATQTTHPAAKANTQETPIREKKPTHNNPTPKTFN